MANMIDFALNMINRNPNIANDPRKREFIDILKNRDAQRGQAMAQNLCNTYGVSQEEAAARARQFFNI